MTRGHHDVTELDAQRRERTNASATSDLPLFSGMAHAEPPRPLFDGRTLDELLARHKRFWSKVDVRRDDGCWNWKASLGTWGYGQFRIDKQRPMRSAHRFSYELTYGPIGDSKVFVCHHCDNRRCVRPDHLFLGSTTDNMRDMARKGHAAGQGQYTTHCKRGHLRTPENTYIENKRSVGGGIRRQCKDCWKEQPGRHISRRQRGAA